MINCVRLCAVCVVIVWCVRGVLREVWCVFVRCAGVRLCFRCACGLRGVLAVCVVWCGICDLIVVVCEFVVSVCEVRCVVCELWFVRCVA